MVYALVKIPDSFSAVCHKKKPSLVFRLAQV